MDQVKTLQELHADGTAVFNHWCPLWPTSWRPSYDDELHYSNKDARLLLIQRKTGEQQKVLSEVITLSLRQGDSWRCPCCEATYRFDRVIRTDRERAVVLATLPKVRPPR